MTSSNGNIVRVTGPLCAGNSPVTGEFHPQRPVTRCFNVFFDLRLNKRLSKQSWGCWFETPSRSLWRHCNAKQLPGYCADAHRNKTKTITWNKSKMGTCGWYHLINVMTIELVLLYFRQKETRWCPNINAASPGMGISIIKVRRWRDRMFL